MPATLYCKRVSIVVELNLLVIKADHIASKVYNIKSRICSPCASSFISRNPIALSKRQSSLNPCKLSRRKINVDLTCHQTFCWWFGVKSAKHSATFPRSTFVRILSIGCGGNLEKAWGPNREERGLFKFLHPKGLLKRARED